ncbi:Glutamate receptor 3.1 like [Actinidia chinensis var. chinensis]|uniref:Glutamate receptor 3.1 like n=1 Tax=Actinidia chinensis var. chinensis TaxID=1590841 RepID=A0A2R6Q3J7_ACTCC|nr:Glutamate receptor 3.1 like [Actinidia chinensis var. chinensis]
MEKNHFWFTLILSVVTALGIVSFALCIASEFKRTKRKDLKLDGRLCYLPGSRAFGLGIAALICLSAAQIIGNFVICKSLCLRERRTSCKAKKTTIASTFLVLSWVSFGVAVILISVATSMNRKQPYGEGWLDGECYIVKDGVYGGAGMLVLVTAGSTLASAIITTRMREVEQGRKVHAQV